MRPPISLVPSPSLTLISMATNPPCRLYCLLALVALTTSQVLASPFVIRSTHQPGVKITYKETRICEITAGVRSYAGYITVPTIGVAGGPHKRNSNSNTNLFFWFFESRRDPLTDPLTLWLQGGPGLGSTLQAVSGHNGPCTVLPDSETAVLNPWSWNGASNMLYLDQPAQTGFSYDEPLEGFVDMTTGDVNITQTPVESNLTVRAGRFASQGQGWTANTTALAASAVVQFLDLWFQEFTQYERDCINIWSQSYGGHFAPDVATSLLQNNKKHDNGTRPFPVGVNSVGIINGLVDIFLQVPSFTQFAVNNTYGIRAYNDSVLDQVQATLYGPGGCEDQALHCTQLQDKYDPLNYGLNATVNKVCFDAYPACYGAIYGAYQEASGRNTFDIGHLMPDSFPPPYAHGYLQNEWVQKELGVKVNYTDPQTTVEFNFVASGDFIRSYTKDIGALLDSGVKVALINGDRDFRCNWLGGEMVSLGVPYSDSSSFAAAGYADISTNATYTGGFVRQFDKFSFSRVFQAGHEVPYYQPETAYEIFARTISGRDVATGKHRVDENYSTQGPADVSHIGVGPPTPPQEPVECYVDYAPFSDRCSPEQIAALADGTAVVVDRVVVSPAA